MRVLIIEPNKIPYESTIDGDLESMQKVVGGLIQLVDLDKSTALVCNEEGKCLGLKGNRRVGKDIIAGTFFICGYDNDWEFCSLTDEQLQKYTERFKEIEQYTIKEVKDSIFVEVCAVDSFHRLKNVAVNGNHSGLYTNEDCIIDSKQHEYEGKILVLRPDVLREDFRKPEYQLWEATGGFGCSPTSSGRAVYARCLYDGEEYRWNRADFIGIIQSERLPDWAQAKLNPCEEAEEMEL